MIVIVMLLIIKSITRTVSGENPLTMPENNLTDVIKPAWLAVT